MKVHLLNKISRSGLKYEFFQYKTGIKLYKFNFFINTKFLID